MALIEREDELARLDTAISEAISGQGSALLIEGPPGIGKTVLLDHIRDLARSAGVGVLSARAAELESDIGFSVVRTLFTSAVRELSTDDRDVVLAGAARLASGPLGLGDDATPAPVELGSAVHGLYWLCANLADRRPLLLAVDDLHWADEPSLLFLSYIARRVTEHPVLVCATTRPVSNEPAERFLTALSAEVRDVIRPQPLSEDGVGQLVRDTFATQGAPEFSSACARVSGGNPFLLIETLTSLRDHGVEPSATEAEKLDELNPETLARSLLSRVARLGPDANRVANAVAVLGPDSELRRVAQIASLEPDRVAEAFSGLRREGILTQDSPLEFVHPLVRNAIYADIAEPSRGLEHLRAARMMDGEGNRERVISHLLVAERSADSWVVDRLREAAVAAMTTGAPASATTLLRRALAEPPAEADRPALDLELGRALMRCGDFASADGALEQVLDVDDPPLRATAALELGRSRRLAGQNAKAIAVLDRAIEQLPEGCHDEDMALEAELAMASHLGLPAKEWVDRLAKVAERADGPSLADRTVRSLYAYVAASTGTRLAADVERLSRSTITPIHPTDLPVLLQTTAAGLAMSGSFEDALGVLDRALETTRELGDVVQFGFVSETRSWVAHRAGRVLECEADAAAGLAVALDGALDLTYAVATLGVALIERGQLAEAEALYDAHGLAETTDVESALAASLFGVRGRLHGALGRAREAVADIERCRDVVSQSGFTSPVFIEWRHDLVLAHLALGEIDEARELAADEVAITREFGAPRELGIALRSSGLAEGNARGLELLEESIDVLADSEAVLDHAKSLVELGAALRRAGRRAQACDQLRLGLDQASRCGSLSVANRARHELTVAGARPRRERLSGPDALTASELRVARLAAEGRTNSEIAQSLFVTRRTVEFHLTNVYRKLTIDSREALSSALTSADERPSPPA